MIEIFRNTDYDFLGKKRWFIILSCLLILAGASSAVWRVVDGDPATRPFNLGIDFAGGTLVNVRFKEKPDLDRLRAALEAQGIAGSKITLQLVSDQIGQTPKNEIFIRLPNLREAEREEAGRTADDADLGSRIIRAALASLNDPSTAQNKIDLNFTGRDALGEELLRLDPLALRAGGGTQIAEARYAEIAARIVDYREQARGGLIGDVDEIRNLSGIETQLGATFEQNFFTGAASVRSAEAVSPQVGADLRNRAVYAVLLACAGMMLFVAFRFKSWGFGIGAVAAVFHDVLITLGIFSIMQWEINLTVIAALLTLVGYSMNDTIVIFDRIREMLRTRRRERLETITNDAINQTLSRTIITSGLTFLAVLSLLLFGGEVLKSFSWALAIGIVVGTYSTIYIASPVMLWWDGRRTSPRPVAAGMPNAAAAGNAIVLQSDGSLRSQPVIQGRRRKKNKRVSR